MGINPKTAAFLALEIWQARRRFFSEPLLEGISAAQVPRLPTEAAFVAVTVDLVVAVAMTVIGVLTQTHA